MGNLIRWIFVVVIALLLKETVSDNLLGVNYGLIADNLPPPTEVAALLKQYKIPTVKIYEPNHDVLEALRGMIVSMNIRNQDLASLAASREAADQWVQKYFAPYNDMMLYLSVGNEVIPGENAQYVLPAMKNIRDSINAAGLSVVLSTTVSMAILGTSYPPSQGAFTEEVVEIMTDITQFLSNNRWPLLLNVYPYFAYSSDPDHISLNYALFNTGSPEFMDGDLAYYNLYEAMIDAVYAAMEKVGGKDVDIVVSETGWPSAGGTYATVENARAYNNNLKNKAFTKGTPRRPDIKANAFIFALFNENQKPGREDEKNFGTFYPSKEPVYPFW